ncbi:MAG: AI-2E family transporter [bacterium]|nr:AI-2E family transporter [bacterium]
MRKKIISLPPPVFALIGYILTVLVVIFSLKHITILAAPVFFSFVIAYLFNPVVNYLDKRTPLTRSMVSALMMITFVFLVIMLLINLFPYVVDEVKLAADKFPETLEKFSDKVKDASNYITKNFSKYVGNFDLMGKIELMLSNALTDLSTIMVAAFSSLYSVLLTLLFLVFIPLISYYFLKDTRNIQRSFFGLIPTRYKEKVIQRVEQMDMILSSFIRGQAMVVFILAILYSVGLSIIGLPFAILIGVMAGIGDIIPYFGTVVGFLVSLVVGLAHYDSMDKLLLIALVFVIVKGTENWYFYPKIVGKEVGLHFVWVLVSIVVFGQLFGFWGLLVCIPAAAGLKVHIRELVDYYKESHFFKKELPPNETALPASKNAAIENDKDNEHEYGHENDNQNKT